MPKIFMICLWLFELYNILRNMSIDCVIFTKNDLQKSPLQKRKERGRGGRIIAITIFGMNLTISSLDDNFVSLIDSNVFGIVGCSFLGIKYFGIPLIIFAMNSLFAITRRNQRKR